MAKRRKGRRSRSMGSARRRRSGGILGAIDTTNILAVAAGAVAAKFVDKVIPDTIDAKMVSGGKVALGIALPMLVKDGKTKALLTGVGSGMVAIGAVELLSSFGVLSGVGADDSDMLVVSLDGVDDLPTINGEDDISVINGDVDVLGADVLAGDSGEDEAEMF